MPEEKFQNPRTRIISSIFTQARNGNTEGHIKAIEKLNAAFWLKSLPYNVIVRISKALDKMPFGKL